MQTSAECYKKVKKDCFKFIKSQETSKDKFKNKEKMIKSFLVPISFWLANKARKKKSIPCRFDWRPRNRQNNNQFNFINYLKKIF